MKINYKILILSILLIASAVGNVMYLKHKHDYKSKYYPLEEYVVDREIKGVRVDRSTGEVIGETTVKFDLTIHEDVWYEKEQLKNVTKNYDMAGKIRTELGEFEVGSGAKRLAFYPLDMDGTSLKHSYEMTSFTLDAGKNLASLTGLPFRNEPMYISSGNECIIMQANESELKDIIEKIMSEYQLLK